MTLPIKQNALFLQRHSGKLGKFSRALFRKLSFAHHVNMLDIAALRSRNLAKDCCTKMYPTCLSGAVLLIFFSTSCTTLIEAISEPKASKPRPQYWLTTSMYVGPFFNNDDLNLMDYRPFSATMLSINQREQLTTPRITSTIAAGTLVEIVNISFPTDDMMKNRPLAAPRDHVAVVLRVARERGRVTMFHEKHHVLLLPKTITHEKQIKTYLSKFLSNKDPSRWILQQQSYIQDGIFKKRPVVGMKRAHLMATLGPALKRQIHQKTNFSAAQEVWHYHDFLITIVDDTVTVIKNLS